MNSLHDRELLPPDFSPELSALEASLASLQPEAKPERREEAKAAALLRFFRRKEEQPPPLSGEKLIETIVRSGDREITLSLREYVRSARFSAATYGVLAGAAAGLLLGLVLGLSLAATLYRPAEATTPVREIHHVPYFVDGRFDPISNDKP